MAELQFVIGGGARFGAAHAVEQSGASESRDDGVVALGLFGMRPAGEVSAAPVVGDEKPGDRRNVFQFLGRVHFS